MVCPVTLYVSEPVDHTTTLRQTSSLATPTPRSRPRSDRRIESCVRRQSPVPDRRRSPTRSTSRDSRHYHDYRHRSSYQSMAQSVPTHRSRHERHRRDRHGGSSRRARD